MITLQSQSGPMLCVFCSNGSGWKGKKLIYYRTASVGRNINNLSSIAKLVQARGYLVNLGQAGKAKKLSSVAKPAQADFVCIL